MSKSSNKYGFWGAPEKIKKLLEEEVEYLPDIHFLFKFSKDNINKLLKDIDKKKIVLLTIFEDN